MGRPDTAAVLGDRLRELAEQVRRGDRMVREGDPEGVHDLRVAMRRSRSLLRTYGRLLPDAQQPEAARLQEELRWAGLELSGLRDLEVMHERIGDLLAVQPAELVLGGVAARIADHERQDGRVAKRRGDALLDDARFTAMLDAVDGFAAAASWERATPGAVRSRLGKDWRRLRQRARLAEQESPARTHEDDLHAVRKAAKRARYAAEVLVPAYGKRAQRMASAAEAVQEALGTHRDTLLSRKLLRELGVQAYLDGDNGFTFGRLHALEEVRGDEALAAYEPARAELERKKQRRWLR